jgi:hypothetical protein
MSIRRPCNNSLSICPVLSGNVRSYVQIIRDMGHSGAHIGSMDASSVSRLAANSVPVACRQDGSAAPKRDRRLTLTKIDKRGRLGKRVAELTAMFASAAGGEVTPMRRLKVEKAAQLTAIAELARGDFMRDGKGTLDDLVRLERKADQAVRALGIDEARGRPKLTVQEYLAQRAAGA